MELSKILQAADTVLVAECDASDVSLCLSVSCLTKVLTHPLLTAPPHPTHPLQMHRHTHKHPNKRRGQMEGCENPPLPSSPFTTSITQHRLPPHLPR